MTSHLITAVRGTQYRLIPARRQPRTGSSAPEQRIASSSPHWIERKRQDGLAFLGAWQVEFAETLRLPLGQTGSQHPRRVLKRQTVVAFRLPCDPANSCAQRNACLHKTLAGTPSHYQTKPLRYRSRVGDQRSPPPNVCR